MSISLNIPADEHVQIIIGSLNKAFEDAKRKGTYSVRELYLLNIIYKTLKYSCEVKATQEQIRCLVMFYHKILSEDNKFCIGNFTADVFADTGFSYYYFQDKADAASGEPHVDDNIIIL